MSASSELQGLVEERDAQLGEAAAALDAKERALEAAEAALDGADAGAALAARAAARTARSYDHLLSSMRKEQLSTARAAASMVASRRPRPV